MNFVNLAAYLFVDLSDTYTAWREPLYQRCSDLDLKGTILLTPEGINLFIAGAEKATNTLLDYLHFDPLFETRLQSLKVKRSFSLEQPFNRMLIKLKKEIITMRKPVVQPIAGRAPAVTPNQLKVWLDQGHDDKGRPIVLLDTRNGFEVDVGAFENAMDWRLKKFGDFPEIVEKNRQQLEGKTVVSYCTGGIRCEKAAIYMNQLGIDSVYQLEGGILNYFEKVGGAHYKGDCFVFDYRTALTPALQPSNTVQCFACRAVVTYEEQQTEQYQVGQYCPHCFEIN